MSITISKSTRLCINLLALSDLQSKTQMFSIANDIKLQNSLNVHICKAGTSKCSACYALRKTNQWKMVLMLLCNLKFRQKLMVAMTFSQFNQLTKAQLIDIFPKCLGCVLKTLRTEKHLV